MTLNRHSCNGHSGLDLCSKINQNRCKICFKLLINWKGVKMDNFVPISGQDTRLNGEAKKILVKEKSSKSIQSLIKRYLGDSTDFIDGTQDNTEETKWEENFKLCKSCFGLIGKLEDHWRQFNEIRDHLRIKFVKAGRLFTAPNRKLFKKTTKCRQNKPKTAKLCRTNAKNNVPNKPTQINAIPSNFTNTHDIPRPKQSQNPSNLEIITNFLLNNSGILPEQLSNNGLLNQTDQIKVESNRDSDSISPESSSRRKRKSKCPSRLGNNSHNHMEQSETIECKQIKIDQNENIQSIVEKTLILKQLADNIHPSQAFSLTHGRGSFSNEENEKMSERELKQENGELVLSEIMNKIKTKSSDGTETENGDETEPINEEAYEAYFQNEDDENENFDLVENEHETQSSNDLDTSTEHLCTRLKSIGYKMSASPVSPSGALTIPKNDSGMKHACTLCRKSFKTQNILRQHMRIHTGDKPFVCDICKKAFSQMASLKYHQATHSDDRPFKCDKCSKTFKLKPPFKKHIKECSQSLHQLYELGDKRQQPSSSSSSSSSSSINQSASPKPLILLNQLINKNLKSADFRQEN